MLTTKRSLAVLIATIAGAASAQTAVTTPGGTTGTVPLFTGTSTVGNSAIKQTGSSIGIGTANPVSALDVNGTISVSGDPVVAENCFSTPTDGTYVIASSARLRGEYTLSWDSSGNRSQSLQILVTGGQFDANSTIQVLQNHSYGGWVIISNPRLLLGPGGGLMFLVVDVANRNGGTTLCAVYRGAADFPYGGPVFGAQFGGLTGSETQVGQVGINVNESAVGIGTTTPAAKLDVNGSIVQRPVAANSAVNYLQTNANNTSDQVNLNPGILFFGGGSGNVWGADLGFGNNRYRTRLFANSSIGDVALSFNSGNPTSQASFTDGLVLRGDSGNVGIGTSSPGARLEVNGGLKLSTGSPGITFGDGTTQMSAGVSPSSTGTAGFGGNLAVQGNLIAGAGTQALPATMMGTLTIASPAQDGQGTATNGLLFVDDVYGAPSAWTHAAIYTVGSSGWNGSLVFATDGDNQPDFGVTEKMRISSNGNVGIGTSTPGSALEVRGNVTLTQGKGGSITYQDGSVQSVAWNGVLQGGDYAESVDVSGDRAEYEPGDVLVVDPNADGRFVKSSQAYSTTVMGIYSTRPGVLGRRQRSDRSHMAEEVPMAMIGVVPTKVTAEGGPIKRGDLLVTSSKPGYAMKGTDHSQMMGAIIGKALGHLDLGTGLIEVAVSLQ